MRKLIEDEILKATSHGELPDSISSVLTKSDYRQQVFNVCFERQLKYSSVVRLATRNEVKYYRLLVEYSEKHRRLFPYHLQERLIALKITPFSYYSSMLTDHLATETSYDQLPNFTAADILRLSGIGRNQYIALLYQTHPKSSISRKLFGRASLAYKLPRHQKHIPLEDWWLVMPGYPTELDVDQLTLKSKWTLDKLIKRPINTTDVDKRCLYELLNEQSAYIDIPIELDDRFRVKMLENFVMNRLSGDYVETALYTVFNMVSSSLTMWQLAELLDVHIESVLQAVSLLNRFGFIEKCKNSLISFDDDCGTVLLYDANLAALLMIGNLSVGLKQHAMQLFEVGRLEFDHLETLIGELRDIDEGEDGGEGEAQLYFDQGRSLLLVLELMRSQTRVDLARVETLNSLSPDQVARFTKAKYKKAIALTPLSAPVPPALVENCVLFGTANGRLHTPWARVTLAQCNHQPLMIVPSRMRLDNLDELGPDATVGPLVKVYSWRTNESQTMKRATCLGKINSLLERHSLLIYAFNDHLTSIPLPTTRNELAKFITDETIKNLGQLLDFEHIYGNLDIMMGQNGEHYIDGVYFGLPLKSLNLTGVVCDGILNDNQPNYQDHFASWIKSIEQVETQYGKVNASHVTMPCNKFLLNP